MLIIKIYSIVALDFSSPDLNSSNLYKDSADFNATADKTFRINCSKVTEGENKLPSFYTTERLAAGTKIAGY